MAIRIVIIVFATLLCPPESNLFPVHAWKPRKKIITLGSDAEHIKALSQSVIQALILELIPRKSMFFEMF